jgi:hypothetical protein
MINSRFIYCLIVFNWGGGEFYIQTLTVSWMNDYGLFAKTASAAGGSECIRVVCLAQNVNMTMSDDQVNQILLSIIEISSSLKLSKIILRSFFSIFFKKNVTDSDDRVP